MGATFIGPNICARLSHPCNTTAVVQTTKPESLASFARDLSLSLIEKYKKRATRVDGKLENGNGSRKKARAQASCHPTTRGQEINSPASDLPKQEFRSQSTASHQQTPPRLRVLSKQSPDHLLNRSKTQNQKKHHMCTYVSRERVHRRLASP